MSLLHPKIYFSYQYQSPLRCRCLYSGQASPHAHFFFKVSQAVPDETIKAEQVNEPLESSIQGQESFLLLLEVEALGK